MTAKFVTMWDEPDNDAPEGTEVILLLRPYGKADAIDAMDVGPDTDENREQAVAKLCAAHNINIKDVIDESVNSNEDL